MKEPKITFERLPDGTSVITVEWENMHGEKVIRQEIIHNFMVYEVLRLAIEAKQKDTQKNESHEPPTTHT